MANDKDYDKKSYVMYKSWTPMILAFSDEQAGILFKAIGKFQAGQQANIDDPLLSGVFEMFKASFSHDDTKYRDRCEKNAINGSKGGRAKADNASKRKQTLANASNSKQCVANLADKDIDTDMGIDMDTDNDIGVDNDIGKENETDTETDTDNGAASSASASVSASSFSSVPAAVPKTEEELMEICKRENIKCNDTDIEYYFGDMVRNNWKDGSGDPIRSVPAHFRDWLKRNADTTVNYCLSEDDYHWIQHTLSSGVFQTIIDEFYENDLDICIGEGAAKIHTLKEFIEMLNSNYYGAEADKLKKALGNTSPSPSSPYPLTVHDLAIICDKENITCDRYDMETYLYKMNTDRWQDKKGSPIKSVGAHFRNWLKNNGFSEGVQSPKKPRYTSDGYEIEE